MVWEVGLLASEQVSEAQGVFPFFLLISAQMKGFRLRRRAPRIQTPFVPVRKVYTALARSAGDVFCTHPVALALELSRWVSGPPAPGSSCGWERRARTEQSAFGSPEAEGIETPTWTGIFPLVNRKWNLLHSGCGYGQLPGEGEGDACRVAALRGGHCTETRSRQVLFPALLVCWFPWESDTVTH